MLRSLFWKEIRESRLAIIAGVVWALLPLTFFIEPQMPSPVRTLILYASFLAPILCVVSLSAGRLLNERTSRSWDFLRSQPIPMWKVMLAKWATALGLGMGFAAISSALAYAPISRGEEMVLEISLPLWVAYHAAAIGFYMSLLLLLDLPDWGDHLILRGLATFAGVMFSMWTILTSEGSNWQHTALFSAVTLTLFGAALLLSSRLRSETGLTSRRFRLWPIRTAARHFSRRSAWAWLQWRHARALWPLASLFVLLLFAVELAGFRLSGSTESWAADFRAIMQSAPAVAAFALFAAATLLGLVPKIADSGPRAAFLHTLPLEHASRERTRLLVALALLAAAAAIPLFFIAMHANWIAHSDWQSILSRCSTLLLKASALLVLVYAGVCLFRRALILPAVLIITFLLIQTSLSDAPQLLALLCLLILVSGLALAPASTAPTT